LILFARYSIIYLLTAKTAKISPLPQVCDLWYMGFIGHNHLPQTPEGALGGGVFNPL